MTRVELHLSGSTWRFRLGAYARSLARPRLLLPICVVAGFPVAVDRAAAWLGGMPGLPGAFAAIGGVAAASLVALGAVAAVLRGGSPSTLVFDDAGIVEREGGRSIARPWRWIEEVVEDDVRLVLHCRAPMRTGRLATSSDARLIVVDKASPEHDALAALLAEHVRPRRAVP